MKKNCSKILNLFPAFFLVSVIFIGWELIVRIIKIPSYLLPAPTSILNEIITKFDVLLIHASVTLQEIILGFILGTTIGIFLALIMSSFKIFRLSVQPLLISSQTFPKEALAPLFIIWFGFGILSKVVITALICFFPVCIGMLRGLDSVDQVSLDLFKVYKAKPREILFKLRVPTSLPYLFSSLRISATLSVIGAVVGEFVGASQGLGHLIRIGNFQLSTELIFASLTFLGLIGIVLYLSMVMLEKLVEKEFPNLRTEINSK